jgi:hypothetical protein
MPAHRETSVSCPTCDTVNSKTAAWLDSGGADFVCEHCGTRIHVGSGDWLVDVRDEAANESV